MPELPEVETTRRGIESHIIGQQVSSVIVRDRRLRWPVPRAFEKSLSGQAILAVRRRGKYLLLATENGTAILHLGMSGSLRILPAETQPGKHDHVDIIFENTTALRFTDPRRFGSIHWTRNNPLQHPLLRELGPEPLQEDFNSDYLYKRSRGRKLSIKAFLMDSHTVVGVGNIYANEALFLAGIHPKRPAGRISQQRYTTLTDCVKTVLQDAIEQGGTTLRDFVNSSGKPGYFQQTLAVYGRGGEACQTCGTIIREIRLGQRSTFFCGKCQR